MAKQQKEAQQKEDYSGLLAAIRQVLKPEKTTESKPKIDWFIALSAATATAIIAIAYFKN